MAAFLFKGGSLRLLISPPCCGTRRVSSSRTTSSLVDRCHSLRSLHPPPAAVASFPVCGARHLRRRRRGFLICRPRHTLMLRFTCHRQRGATRPDSHWLRQFKWVSTTKKSAIPVGMTDWYKVAAFGCGVLLLLLRCPVCALAAERLRCTQTAATHSAPLPPPLAAVASFSCCGARRMSSATERLRPSSTAATHSAPLPPPLAAVASFPRFSLASPVQMGISNKKISHPGWDD